MAITRKRKAVGQEDGTPCKRTKYTDTSPGSDDTPQTPQASKKRITIRLIAPSAPRKIRLRIPIPMTETRLLTPYPSPPLDAERDEWEDLGRGFERPEMDGGLCEKRDVNELLDLYYLADGFRQESLKREVLEKIESGDWMGKVEVENLRKGFEELESGDGVRRWMVRGLLAVWTGGGGMGFECGVEEDWSWVSEEMRMDVLSALRDGEDF